MVPLTYGLTKFNHIITWTSSLSEFSNAFTYLLTLNETFMFTSETNFNYYKSINDLVLEDITKFYIPKHYVGSELVEINEFSDFKEGTSPFTVFDVIESFNRHITNSEGFENEINTILKLNKEENKTILYITHYMEEAVLADRVIVLNEGKIEFDDSPKKVFSNVETLRELGLSVPQVTELAYLLKNDGVEIPSDILTNDEMIEFLERKLK